MKIARYIGDLLYDYECVVIPGLGGFLTNDKPATIQPHTHHFRPPYKQVMFNAYLKANDGLLVNYIAREENISYKEAKAQVDKFVFLCNQALESGKRINFHRVGSLYRNNKGLLVFEQDNSVNYNAEAFGLTGFVSPAVRRVTAEEKLREAVSEEKKPERNTVKKADRKATPSTETLQRKHQKLIASKRKSPYRTQLAFLTLLIIAMMVGWGFMNKEKVSAYYNNYSSVIPLFYSQPNAYLINNIDKMPVEKVSSSRLGSLWISLFDKSEAPKKEAVAKAAPVKPKTTSVPKANSHSVAIVKKAGNTVTATPKPVKRTTATRKTVVRPTHRQPSPKPVTSAPTAVSRRHFFIIAGAFQNMNNVKHLIFTLKKEGYEALVAGTTPAGLHRVAYGAFESRWEARKTLRKIRRQENPSAWILVK
jgi:hypothetical protein